MFRSYILARLSITTQSQPGWPCGGIRRAEYIHEVFQQTVSSVDHAGVHIYIYISVYVDWRRLVVITANLVGYAGKKENIICFYDDPHLCGASLNVPFSLCCWDIGNPETKEDSIVAIKQFKESGDMEDEHTRNYIRLSQV